MKYQLVLQLPAASIQDFDEMIELEEILNEGLGDLGEVDGHDAGSGEMNIFIFTDQPQVVLERVKSLFSTRHVMPNLKAAYREADKEDFTIIHPPGLTHFAIA